MGCYFWGFKVVLEAKMIFLRPARTWILKIDPVRIVGMHVCVCVSTPKAINN